MYVRHCRICLVNAPLLTNTRADYHDRMTPPQPRAS
jgi:hypothetical protein